MTLILFYLFFHINWPWPADSKKSSNIFSQCRRQTVLKLTPDGHTIKEMFKFSSDHKHIGPFVRACYAIVWPRVEFLRVRQQLRVWWQIFGKPKNFWTTLRRFVFVLSLCVHGVHFVLHNAIVRAYYQIMSSSFSLRVIFPPRTLWRQYEGNKKMPDCLRKATWLHEALLMPSCRYRIIVRWHSDGITVRTDKARRTEPNLSSSLDWEVREGGREGGAGE